MLQKFNPWFLMSVRALITSMIGLIIIIIFYPNLFNQIDLQSFLLVTSASVSGALGLICMISALRYGTLRQLGIFNLITILFTIAYLLLFENFILLDYLSGTFLILIGFIIYILQIKKQSKGEYDLKVLLNYTLMSFFFASSGIIHWNNLKKSIPPIFSVVNQELIVFVICSLVLLSSTSTKYVNFNIIKMVSKTYKQLICMALLIVVAVWTSFLGLKVTNPFLASLLSLTTPILTILLGVFFNNEKYNHRIILAIFFMIIGAYVLHLNLDNILI